MQAPSVGRLKFIRKVRRAPPTHPAQCRSDAIARCKKQCADKPLRPEGASERQFALSCRPNRAGNITPSLAFQTSSAPCLGSSIASTVASAPRDSRGMRPFAFGAGLSHALHQVGKRDCSSSQRSHHDGIAKEHCCLHNLWTATLMLCDTIFLTAEYLCKIRRSAEIAPEEW